MRYVLMFLAIYVLILLTLFSYQRSPSVKVSINDRIYNEPKASDDGAIYFGFDLRLNPKEDVSIYLSLLSYLEKETGYKFKIRFAKEYEDNIDNLGQGVIDIAAMGSVSCLLSMDKYGAYPIVTGLSIDKSPAYRAVIFTLPNSKITSIADLAGKKFAFGDKYSTQGHIIPKNMLETAGLLDKLKGVTFSGSHENTLKAVLNYSFDAGSIQDTLAYEYEKNGLISILAVSDESPRSLICASPKTNKQIMDKIQTALLKLDVSGNDGLMLYNWDKTEMAGGFGEVDFESLETISELINKYGLADEITH